MRKRVFLLVVILLHTEKTKQKKISFIEGVFASAVCRLHQRCAAYISGVKLTSAVCPNLPTRPYPNLNSTLPYPTVPYPA